MTQRLLVFRSGVLTAIAATIFANCMDDGGLNRNERTPGNGENGVPVWVGEIAIDPTGQYLVSSINGRLIHGDLTDGATRTLTKLAGTTRLAFDHAGRTLFASRVAVDVDAKLQLRDGRLVADVKAESGRLVRYDVAQNKELWSRPVDIVTRWSDVVGLDTYPYFELTTNDEQLILTHLDHVEVLAADSGKQRWTTDKLPRQVVDVDLTPDQAALVITLAQEWANDTPRTRVQIRDLATFTLREVEVPNCAAELVITPDGKRALLAPPTCQPDPEPRPESQVHKKDPVSVIDLEQGSFVRNLPGFGPVALAPGGALAVAFMDTESLDPTLFDDPAQIPKQGGPRYRLMLIDTASLSFDTIELGDEVPRYALSPDGQLLLVDSPSFWRDGRIRILDTQTKQLSEVAGPELSLDNYVMTRDSSQVFLLSGGLFRISLAERRAFTEPITFTPTRINITPDDRQLVLRENDKTLWLYDTQTSELRFSMNLDL
jgi:DNA-binding beta-propeller fold protein YncE